MISRRDPVGEPVIIERVGDAATLYRANDLNPVAERTGMDTIYDRPRPVYFVNQLNANYRQLREYLAKSGPYVKTFRLKAGEVLRLIDMSKAASWAWVASMMTDEELDSLNVSFPLKGDSVKRVSGDDEEEDDLNVVKAICDILKRHPVADGYYSEEQPRSAEQPDGFHAEVGLCPAAFTKFTHVGTEVRRPAGPPRVVPRNEEAQNGETRKRLRDFVNKEPAKPLRARLDFFGGRKRTKRSAQSTKRSAQRQRQRQRRTRRSRS